MPALSTKFWSFNALGIIQLRCFFSELSNPCPTLTLPSSFPSPLPPSFCPQNWPRPPLGTHPTFYNTHVKLMASASLTRCVQAPQTVLSGSLVLSSEEPSEAGPARPAWLLGALG